MIRVLLVDDHAVMRTGFRMILEAAGDIEVVGEAGDGRAAVAAAREVRPDVICMDVQMPDMDGLEATRRIVADAEVAASVVIVPTGHNVQEEIPAELGRMLREHAGKG